MCIAKHLVWADVHREWSRPRADDHRKVLENFSSDQVCPVVPDIHDWERRKALGGDRYSYYGDFDSLSGSSDYDDPNDYREWYAWSDIEVDERYCDPFQEEVGASLSLLVVSLG